MDSAWDHILAYLCLYYAVFSFPSLIIVSFEIWDTDNNRFLVAIRSNLSNTISSVVALFYFDMSESQSKSRL